MLLALPRENYRLDWAATNLSASRLLFQPGRGSAKRSQDRAGIASLQLPSEGSRLFIERSWSADDRTIPKIESQGAFGIPGNADPDAAPDLAGLVAIVSEP